MKSGLLTWLCLKFLQPICYNINDCKIFISLNARLRNIYHRQGLVTCRTLFPLSVKQTVVGNKYLATTNLFWLF